MDSGYYFGNFARRIQIVLPSCLQRVQGHPDIKASHRTLRRWHQEQAAGARLVRLSMILAFDACYERATMVFLGWFIQLHGVVNYAGL
ncbi:hypothetical protein VI817_005031 [Penicillium citrinum]|uniref:Uncharacterized protein n=1 Tax=Penicillium hetheringtonii TaxID=911720 RepID=A0AAD6DD14_9EURO|nr:hypothetical protein N7450_008311 [Penicillium hetheringtonii]KAK5795746.1 hypothetical protein VI817_005031 [Penicillium citrinum]